MVRYLWEVQWVNPESRSGEWETYQTGLSRRRAEQLAKDLSYVLTPRWFGVNVPARAVVQPTLQRLRRK